MSRLLQVSARVTVKWAQAQVTRLRGENSRQRSLDQLDKRMRLMGIDGISPRAFAPVITIQSKPKSTLPDLVKRLFVQGQLNRVWMSDITYPRTGEGWLYLCAIRDGHSRRVLGWAMDSAQDSYLVERALRMAYALRGDVSDELVVHADRARSLRAASCGKSVKN
jgi:transposase InsO family protein